VAARFSGFDWKAEEDAFMDCYHNHEKGGEFVTYARLRAMGTNGFQEPDADFKDGMIVGTKRLYADGKFNTKAKPSSTRRSGAGCRLLARKRNRRSSGFLVNNGRTNHVWQSAYLDQQNDFVMDRYPSPFIEMNPQDMAELNIKAGDLVDATQAMVYPTARAKPDLHAVRQSDGRAGQRRLQRCERVHYSELQADLGERPKARRCS